VVKEYGDEPTMNVAQHEHTISNCGFSLGSLRQQASTRGLVCSSDWLNCMDYHRNSILCVGNKLGL
jgi:hypothetical protein